MKLFLVGLATAFVGFVAWFSLSAVFGLLFGVAGGIGVEVEAEKNEVTAWLVIPFLLMAGGPIVCWLLIPAYRLTRRWWKRLGR